MARSKKVVAEASFELRTSGTHLFPTVEGDPVRIDARGRRVELRIELGPEPRHDEDAQDFEVVIRFDEDGTKRELSFTRTTDDLFELATSDEAILARRRADEVAAGDGAKILVDGVGQYRDDGEDRTFTISGETISARMSSNGAQLALELEAASEEETTLRIHASGLFAEGGGVLPPFVTTVAFEELVFRRSNHEASPHPDAPAGCILHDLRARRVERSNGPRD